MEIGDHAVERKVDVAQCEVPIAEFGGEISHIIARQHGVADLDVHAYLIDILPVFEP